MNYSILKRLNNKLFFFENIYVYFVLLSYFLLWDFSYGFINLKYSIFIIFFFLFYKKINYFNYKLIFYLSLFFIAHLIINNFFFKIPFNLNHFKGLILLVSSIFFVLIFKDKIIQALENIFSYFPLLFVPFSLLSLEHNSLYHEKLDFKCSYLMYESKIFKIFFLEYSHYGMVYASLLLFNLYKLSIENKNILKNKFRYLSLLSLIVSSFYFGSTTLYFGVIVSILFIFMLFRFLNSFLITLLTIFLLIYSFIFFDKGACNRKLTDLSLYIDQYQIQKDNFSQIKTIENEIIKLDGEYRKIISNTSILFDELSFLTNKPINSAEDVYSILENLDSNHKEIDRIKEIINIIKKNESNLDKISTKKNHKLMNKNDIDIKIETNFHTVNMSTQVIIKSLITSFKSFLSNPFGYGINNYEFAYFKFNTTELKDSFFSKDTFFINYNDAASNFPKLITEFGIFNLLILILCILFFFNNNFDIVFKIISIPILVSLSARAAGYFNAGFTLSLILILILYLKKYDPK